MTSSRKRRLTVATAVLALGLIALGGPATAAPQAQPNQCRRVAVPPTLPFWRCVNLTPGISMPSGCFTTYRVACVPG